MSVVPTVFGHTQFNKRTEKILCPVYTTRLRLIPPRTPIGEASLLSGIPDRWFIWDHDREWYFRGGQRYVYRPIKNVMESRGYRRSRAVKTFLSLVDQSRESASEKQT